MEERRSPYRERVNYLLELLESMESAQPQAREGLLQKFDASVAQLRELGAAFEDRGIDPGVAAELRKLEEGAETIRHACAKLRSYARKPAKGAV